WSVLVITMTILLLVTATANAAPGNGQGNAWGRVARDMQEEKSPGSIASLVHQLKAGTLIAEPPVVEENEAGELLVDVPVMVTVVGLTSSTDEDSEGFIYTATVLVPGEDAEDSVEVDVTIDEDLYLTLSELEEGAEIELYVDEDGNYLLRLPLDENSSEALEGEGIEE
ncbi:MAG TPA: hypothetical protein VK905_03880, partial [Bacillota bacterium]|nr:hypothetical protein [Bacillota bacterium]